MFKIRRGLDSGNVSITRLIRRRFNLPATSDRYPDSDLRFWEVYVLKMTWHCEVCQRGNACDVPGETHFFGVVLMAKTDHELINPSCGWVKIHVRLLRPLSTFTQAPLPAGGSRVNLKSSGLEHRSEWRRRSS